jgi:hypothetical protein
VLVGQNEIQVRCLLRQNTRYHERETAAYMKEMNADQEYLKEK